MLEWIYRGISKRRITTRYPRHPESAPPGFHGRIDVTSNDLARADLAEAVSLLVERPALDLALKAATTRFAADPEGAFAEQQRLLKRKLELEGRLGQIAGRRAGSAAEPSPAQGLASASAPIADITDASS